MKSQLMTSGSNFKLSVVMPAFNSSKYIEESLQSVFQQTRPAYEVIVIDDGSTDNTAEIAMKFPVKLVKQTNQGPSKARNLGIEVSEGDWIAFLDADDLWHKSKIESIEEVIKIDPEVEMISSSYKSGNQASGWKTISPRKLFNKNENLFKQIYRRNFIATSSVVIKKEVLNEVGVFNSSLPSAEDFDLWLRIALAQKNYHYINNPLLYYRIHDTSLTSNPLYSHDMIEDIFNRYAPYAGYTLFFKRVIIWKITIILSLLQQKKYYSSIWCFTSLLWSSFKSPFVYQTRKTLNKKSHLINVQGNL